MNVLVIIKKIKDDTGKFSDNFQATIDVIHKNYSYSLIVCKIH